MAYRELRRQEQEKEDPLFIHYGWPVHRGGNRLLLLLDEVVLYLGAFHDHEFTPLGSQGGLDILGAETHEPVTMLDHDRLNLGDWPGV